jgi:hypothetical protein
MGDGIVSAASCGVAIENLRYLEHPGRNAPRTVEIANRQAMALRICETLIANSV